MGDNRAFAKDILQPLGRAIKKGTIEPHEVEEIIDDAVDDLLVNVKVEFADRYNDMFKVLKKHGLLTPEIEETHHTNVQECIEDLDSLREFANKELRDKIVAIANEELSRNRRDFGATMINISNRSYQLLIAGWKATSAHAITIVKIFEQLIDVSYVHVGMLSPNHMFLYDSIEVPPIQKEIRAKALKMSAATDMYPVIWNDLPRQNLYDMMGEVRRTIDMAL